MISSLMSRFKDLYNKEIDILSLESYLGTFTLDVKPGPADETIYTYKVGNLIGKPSIFRQDALLEFFIQYKDIYKEKLNSQLV